MSGLLLCFGSYIMQHGVDLMVPKIVSGMVPVVSYILWTLETVQTGVGIPHPSIVNNNSTDTPYGVQIAA